MPVSEERRGFNINNMLTFVPESHEKALKQAFYNIAAILFVLFASVAAVAVYYIMEPFLSPLLWAVLFGSVLHPLKQSLTDVIKNWFGGLQASGTPVCLGVVTFPILIVDRLSENLMHVIIRFWKLLLVTFLSVVLIGLLLYILPYNFIFSVCILTKNVLTALAGTIISSVSGYVVSTVILAYVAMVVLYWTPESQSILRMSSLPVWLLLFMYLTAVAGPLREPLFMLLILLIVVGSVTYLKGHTEENSDAGNEIDEPSFIDSFKQQVHNFIGDSDSAEEPISMDKVGTSDLKESPQKPKLNLKLKLSEQKLSNMYLYFLFLACIVVQFWIHISKIAIVVTILLLYILLKYIGYRLGLWSFMSNPAPVSSGCWLGNRRDVLLPGPIRGVWTLILKGDTKIMEFVDGAIDETISIVVIIMMFLFAISGTVFLVIQVYTESVHLVDLTSNLINRTIVHNPHLREMLPAGIEDEIQATVSSAMDNAYMYGRNYTAGAVRSLIQEEDSTKATAIELQVLQILDNLYNAWMSKNETTVDESKQSHNSYFDSLFEDLKKPGVLNLSFITEIVKENLGTLMSVLDSVWIVFKGNINIIVSLLTGLVSVLLVGGTAVINFFVNFVIFMTALVYLLCASGKRYKPVELAGKLLPLGSGTGLGEAFNEAVNSVFAATFKRACFYGLYTWLLHTVLAVQMIYIPAVLAAVLGAIPFLGTYWACFPAIIELFLVNGDTVGAVAMLVSSFLPMSFVDSAINAEIKSGHPYLTALAIAGGMFCLGMAGALVGPIVLCLLSVVVQMYGSFMADTPVGERIRYPLKRFSTVS